MDAEVRVRLKEEAEVSVDIPVDVPLEVGVLEVLPMLPVVP